MHSLDDNNAERFETKNVICQGCAAAPEDSEAKPAHGEKTYVISRMSEDDSEREPYLYEEDFGGSHDAPPDAPMPPTDDTEDGGI